MNIHGLWHELTMGILIHAEPMPSGFNDGYGQLAIFKCAVYPCMCYLYLFCNLYVHFCRHIYMSTYYLYVCMTVNMLLFLFRLMATLRMLLLPCGHRPEEGSLSKMGDTRQAVEVIASMERFVRRTSHTGFVWTLNEKVVRYSTWIIWAPSNLELYVFNLFV